MNYSELSQALQDYLQTSETTFVSQIPTFVKQAEQRIQRDTVLPYQRKVEAGNMTSGNRYLQKPGDHLSSFSISVTDNSGDEWTLMQKSENFIREAYPSASSDTGIPRFYAHYNDDYWVLGPTPDDNYNVVVRCYYDPPSIVTAGTTWLGDNADTALLYGSLVEAYTFLKGDTDLIQLYDQRYKEALINLETLGYLRIMRDDYREHEIKMKVEEV